MIAAIGPMICTSAGLALMSAAESRLVLRFSALAILRPMGSVFSVIDAMLFTDLMSGPPCSTRPRSRRSELSRRRSLPLVYVDGSVRDRQVSPSSLSNISSCADIPTNPSSSASLRLACMLVSS